MSAQPAPSAPFRGVKLDTGVFSSASGAPSSFWDRISKWSSENKAIVYTIAGVAVVVTGAGVVYYLQESSKEQAQAGERRASKKERRKAKKEKEEEELKKAAKPEDSKKATVETVSEELPDVNEDNVNNLDEETRKSYAAKLKAAGNKAYGDKRYDDAIELYGKAILCKADPIFYSNRAACYNALNQWEKVVEDTSAALALDNQYVKALNRRANAYEHLSVFSESLIDYTASCIIDNFQNDASANSVERLLKKLAEQKSETIIKTKEKKLPSTSFINNYLQSFRPQPLPTGLEDTADVEEESGKGQMQLGLRALSSRTGEGFEKASQCFDKAIELGDLGEHEALAYNIRGTFSYLCGENDNALQDLNKSIQLDPSLTQSYIKRASLHLETGKKEPASKDFELAMAKNDQDPDIYYHRAQLHFILGDFEDAAKDYQKSIELDRDFIFSHIQLGVTQYKMGSIASSMATFRRTVKNFDRVPDVYNYYGELLLDQQKYEEAIEKFDTAVDMEKASKPLAMNVLPIVNKALAIFQWKQDYAEAEKLCQKALIFDPECDIAVATMAQLLLQQNKVTEALKYFERAAELSRTPPEIINALSYAEATRTQLEITKRYPSLANKLAGLGAGAMGMR